MSFLICLAALAAAHLVPGGMLVRDAREWVARTLSAIAVLALLTASSLTLVRIFIVPHAPWNEARLTSTTAILKGYPIYARPGSGPIGDFMYGPVGALVYVPAAVVRAPTVGLLLASALAALMFFAPAAWLIRTLAPSTSQLGYLCALTCFIAIVHHAPTLDNTSVWIHVDAPALGLAACAAVLAIRGRPALAAIGAALSIWSKQTMGLILCVLPIAMLLLHGRRKAAINLAATLAALVLLAVVFALLFDPRAMLFQMILLPARQPWGSTSQITKQMAMAFWPAAVLLVGALSFRPVGSSRLWLLPVGLTIALLPGSFLGWIKEGGSPNNAGLSMYFLLIAGCAVLAECEIPRFLARRRDAIQIGQLLVVLVATQYVIHAAFGDGLLAWRFRMAMDAFNNGTEYAYRFERAHPGEAYFPWNPHAVLLASGNLYPFDYAIHDRNSAGLPPDDAQVRAALPKKLRYIAYPPQITPSMDMMPLIPGFGRRVELPELPQFLIYARTSYPLTSQMPVISSGKGIPHQREVARIWPGPSGPDPSASTPQHDSEPGMSVTPR